MAKCADCGQKVGFTLEVCDACYQRREEAAQAKRDIAARKEREYRARVGAVVLTTAHSVVGKETVRTIDIITAETVLRLNTLRNLFAGFGDGIVSGRTRSQENVLREARTTCLRGLREEAVECDADAVIGVVLSYSEFTAFGDPLLFLVASGTAVTLVPIPVDPAPVSGQEGSN